MTELEKAIKELKEDKRPTRIVRFNEQKIWELHSDITIMKWLKRQSVEQDTDSTTRRIIMIYIISLSPSH